MKYITLIDEENNVEITLNQASFVNTLRSYEGWESAPIINVISDLPSSRAAYFSGSKYTARRLNFSGDIYGPNVFELRRRLISPTVANGKLKLLKFETFDGLKLQCYVTVDRITMPYQATNPHRFSFELIAPDPMFYSQEATGTDINMTAISGGTGIPTDIPMSLGGSSSSGTNPPVVNDGNGLIYPTFEIHGPGNTFMVENRTTGQAFKINATLDPGDIIVVDTENLTVTYKGTNVYDAFEGDFMHLAPGDNIIVLEVASGGVYLTSKVRVLTRASYLGI